MFFKMAFHNLEKSFKYYWVYFFTLTFGIAVFYIFNSIPVHQKLLVMNGSLQHTLLSLKEMIEWLSLAIAIIMGAVIVYVNWYLLRQRRKEIGLYLLHGMTKSSMAVSLFLETCGLSVGALMLGLLFGIFGSQFLSILTAKIYMMDVARYHFIFSAEALMRSICYFGIIFIMVSLLNHLTIKRSKLVILLQNKNTECHDLAVKKQLLMGLIGCLAVLVLGTFQQKESLAYVYKSISVVFLIAFGTMVVLWSIAKGSGTILSRKKSIAFRGLNSFIWRQVIENLQRNVLSLTAITILLTLSICIFFVGYSIQAVLSKDLETPTPYDFSLHEYNEDDRGPIAQNLTALHISSNSIGDIIELPVHYTGASFSDYGDNDLLDVPVILIGVSDYNQSMRLGGLPEVSLSPRRYAITTGLDSQNMVNQCLKNEWPSLNLAGVTLYPEQRKELFPISNNMNSVYIIVPDAVANFYPVKERIINIQAANPIAEKQLQGEIKQYQLDFYQSRQAEYGQSFYYFDKTEIFESATLTKAMVTFLIIYFDFVVIIFCGAVLAIQQLSGISERRKNYLLLYQLGVDTKTTMKALLHQVMVLFSIPLLLAILYSLGLLTYINTGYQIMYSMNLLQGVMATAAFTLTIYMGYAALTYFSAKKIIEKEFTYGKERY